MRKARPVEDERITYEEQETEKVSETAIPGKHLMEEYQLPVEHLMVEETAAAMNARNQDVVIQSRGVFSQDSVTGAILLQCSTSKVSWLKRGTMTSSVKREM